MESTQPLQLTKNICSRLQKYELLITTTECTIMHGTIITYFFRILNFTVVFFRQALGKYVARSCWHFSLVLMFFELLANEVMSHGVSTVACVTVKPAVNVDCDYYILYVLWVSIFTSHAIAEYKSVPQ